MCVCVYVVIPSTAERFELSCSTYEEATEGPLPRKHQAGTDTGLAEGCLVANDGPPPGQKKKEPNIRNVKGAHFLVLVPFASITRFGFTEARDADNNSGCYICLSHLT